MSVTNNNLDLYDVESDNIEELANRIESFYKNDATIKTNLSSHWERNHLFLDGKQWLTNMGTGLSTTGTMWQPIQISRANEYIPRPVTNYTFDAYQTLKAYLLKDRPRTTVYPNTQTHRDKTAAKIASLVLEANYERLKEEYNYEYAAACVITYGTVFKKDYWNASSIQMAKIPRTQPQPIIDPMTGQQVGMEDRPVLDEAGEPIVDYLPIGDVDTDIIEPYRIAVDPLANDIHKARWIMEYSIQPIPLVIEWYDRQEKGYTGLAKELKEEKKLNGAMQRFYNLKQSTGIRQNGLLGEGAGGTSQTIENTVVLKEYYERPCAKYPKGRLIVVANGITLYADESPYEGEDLGDWHPYSECRWEVVAGRFWGKSPLDDVCNINKDVNSIDSVITLTRKTMAIPQKKIPIGCGVAAGQWTGRPAQEIFYRVDPSGAGPEVIPPTGVSEQVFQERAQRVEDIKQISGAIDILKGDRPAGVTAASALNMLYEVGTGKLYPVLARWKKFVESSQKKQLKLIGKHYKEPREAFIKLLKRKNSELSPQEISHFIGTDLCDNFNVNIEAGSYVPKLQAAHQAALEQAAASGALQLENPSNRIEYLRQMNIDGFDTDLGKDIKRAQWENDLMDDIMLSPDNKPIVLMVDNHDVHSAIHGDRMKEPSFFDLSQEVQQAYMMHLQEHDNMKAQLMQQQAMEAMALGVPPQGGSPEPQGPMGKPPAPKEGPQVKGPTTQQKNALKSDMLQPAPIGGK